MVPRIVPALVFALLLGSGCHLTGSLEGFSEGIADAGASAGEAGPKDATPDHDPVADAGEEGGDEPDVAPAQPVVLAHDESSPWAVAVGAERVFWVTQGDSGSGGSATGAVRSVPAAGGSVTVVATDQNGPVDLAYRDGFVYWACFSGSGNISRAPDAGGEAKVLANANAPWSVTVDDSFVYWTSRQDGSVHKLPVGGGAEPAPLADGETPGQLPGLAASGSSLYWVDTERGEIRAVDKNGGPIRVLADGLVNPLNLAVEGEHLVWVEAGASFIAGACADADGRVGAASAIDGSDRTILAEGQACPRAVAFDGSEVAWVNHGLGVETYLERGTVAIASLEGSGVRILATDQPRPVDVAFLPDSVVWVSMGTGPMSGSVTKVAR